MDEIYSYQAELFHCHLHVVYTVEVNDTLAGITL